MICETCQGKGTTRKWLSLMGGEMWADVPCPECGGTGIVSCCEGAERFGQLEEDGDG